MVKQFRMESAKGFVAVAPPKFDKIETKVNDFGIALNTSRTNTISQALVMDHITADSFHHAAVTRAILPGDSGLHSWAKKIYEIAGIQFVMVPESLVLGFVIEENGVSVPDFG